jgi:hypothetical protein
VEWWDKKSEALILDERSREVLDSWESKKSDGRFANNIDVLALVARAFSKRHRTDDGLSILNEALNRNPSNAVLLAERGLLFAGLHGRLNEIPRRQGFLKFH